MCRFRRLLLSCILCLFVGTSFAAFSVDSFIADFQSKQAMLSLAEKKAYYLQVYNNLSLLAIRNRSDAEQLKIFTTLKDYINTQIQNL